MVSLYLKKIPEALGLTVQNLATGMIVSRLIFSMELLYEAHTRNGLILIVLNGRDDVLLIQSPLAASHMFA
jgi:hypothetical protein